VNLWFQRTVRWVMLVLLSANFLYTVVAHFSSFFTNYFVDHPKNNLLIHFAYVSILLACFVEIMNRKEDPVHSILSVFRSFQTFFVMLFVIAYSIFTMYFAAIMTRGRAVESSGKFYFMNNNYEFTQEIDQSTYIFQRATAFRRGSFYWIFTAYLAILTVSSIPTTTARDKPTESV
jgi:hypothetical protein